MPITKPLVIVLLGPTASGKTALAIEIAERIKLTIHNIDSRQVYIGMDIGTAKPSQKQQQRIHHHLIDLCHPDQPITVQEFQHAANSSLKPVLKSQGKALLVGGSGLYLKALTKGLRPPEVSAQPILRDQLKQLGQDSCYKLLKNADPVAANRISPADVVRTQRALEVLYATGKPISKQQKCKPPPWNILELGIDPPNLQERISKRTAELYQNGLVEETQKLVNKFGSDLPLLKTMGYQEALLLLEGQLNLKAAIAITTSRTQKFAKRQRTWFRKQHSPHWLNDEEPLREALLMIKAGLGC